MTKTGFADSWRRPAGLIGSAVFSLLLCSVGAWAGENKVQLKNHVPTAQIARAWHLDRMPSDSRISLAVTLQLKDQAGLEARLKRLYDSADPEYGHYLTPAQFAEAYAPSNEEYNQVVQNLQEQGLNIVRTDSSRTLIDVEGAVSDIENGFQIEIHRYLTQDGRIVHAPTSDPSVSESIAPLITGIVGLENFATFHPNLVMPNSSTTNVVFGSAPNGTGLAPADINEAYELAPGTTNGSGQSLALFEMDGYTTADITAYEVQFGMTASPGLTFKPVDGATGTPSVCTPTACSPLEVTLDIEMMLAIAPGASTIYIYETPNTGATWTNILDAYQDIANDYPTTHASVVSTSWANGSESQVPWVDMASESTIFIQMAAQGQSFFAAAGDHGAYETSTNENVLSVQDPCGQPHATCVGGTKLTLNNSGSYQSEASWGDPLGGNCFNLNTGLPWPCGGGGGISTVWAIPAWQSGLATSSNLGSATARMVPDVSLDAATETGYGIYFSGNGVPGNWQTVGGTSAAAPLWAAFTALVNRQRVAGGLSTLGFANPSIYQIAQSSLYSQTFHDIDDLSSNLFYPAVSGYDLSTGWGSFQGQNLLQALSRSVFPPLAPINVQVVKITGGQ